MVAFPWFRSTPNSWLGMNILCTTCDLNNGKQSISFVFRCDYIRQWFRDQRRNIDHVSVNKLLSLHRVILNDVNWIYCLLCRTTENTRSLSVESDVGNEKRKTLLHPHEEAERTRAASKYIHVCDYIRLFFANASAVSSQ